MKAESGDPCNICNKYKATKCQAWAHASNSYKNSQAKYAKDSFNIGIDSKKEVSQDILNSLNKVYEGASNFELVNNKVDLWIPEIEISR